MSEDKSNSGLILAKIDHDFIFSMFNLIEDFNEISPERHKDVITSLTNTEKKGKPNRHEVINFFNKKTKFEQIQFAMFNYMNSVFERNVNNCLKYAISNNDDVNSIYISKFIDYEKTLSKPIRDSNYEKASDQERTQIRMRYFDQIISLIPSNWQMLLNIPDSLMWDNKYFKYQFTELRARRNLLTHRGSRYDEKYVNEIKNSISKSKKSVDLDDGFSFYCDKGFFGYSKNDLKDIDSLHLDEKTVIMRPLYILTVFELLLKSFNLIRLFSDKKTSITTSLQVKLINLGIQFENIFFFRIARTLAIDHIFASVNLENDDEEIIFIKGNYLLSCIEEKKVLNKYEKKYEMRKNEVKYFEELKNINLPIIELLISIYNGNEDKYELILNKFNNNSLTELAIDWPIFNEIKKNDRLLEILKTKIKD